jgi:hypothetical protein
MWLSLERDYYVKRFVSTGSDGCQTLYLEGEGRIEGKMEGRKDGRKEGRERKRKQNSYGKWE